MPRQMTRTRPRRSATERGYGPAHRAARDRRTTAGRGYGGPHVAARKARLAAFTPGQPCAIGGEPLWQHTRRKYGDLLDLAHDHVRGGYLGLSCRYHNRSDGAVHANHLRVAAGLRPWPAATRRPPPQQAPAWTTSRDW